MQNSYDQVPYPGQPFSQSHPDHLAALARLLGVEAHPIDRCRVLELGCAGGANLIPMAATLPQSDFVGIDASAGQIADGQAVAAKLGLQNVDLRPMDIMDLTDEVGRFHYIIAHGVYSWVAPDVQEKILQICKRSLAPTGIAYISYNAYPGWHLMSIIRDAMRYQTRNVSDPHDRAAKARATLAFLASSVSAERAHGAFVQAYASFLKHEASRIGAKADSFLLHDELEDHNQPLYFHEFAERAARHGLEYLAEADFQSVFTANYAPEVATALENSSDNLIDLEQMMDFVRNRMFRQTLLCHDDIAINRTLSTSKLPGLFARSQARPVSPDPDICTVSPEQFRASGGATLTIDHPASKAAMVYLARIAPRASLVEKLCAIARRRVDKCTSPNQLAATAERDDEIVMANLLKAFSYSSNLVQFHVHVPSIATVPSEFPVASPVVRLQAQDNDTVTNLWHERVSVNDTGRRLLCFLDGNNSRDDIFDHLMSEAKQGRLSVKRNDAVVVDKADLRDVLVRNIDLQLSWAAHSALLIR